MKRILALILTLVMLLPLCACASQSLEAKTEEAKTEEKKTEEAEKTGPITYPEGYSVGYATIDISGQTPIAYFGGIAKGINDPLLLTCTAISDGETVALVMTADLKKMLDNVVNRSLQIIEKQFGIPAAT